MAKNQVAEAKNTMPSEFLDDMAGDAEEFGQSFDNYIKNISIRAAKDGSCEYFYINNRTNMIDALIDISKLMMNAVL